MRRQSICGLGVCAVMLSAAVFASAAHGEEMLVFVSEFASGDDGAIRTFRLETETGKLTEVQRATDIEQPFFLALSPDRKYLYATHAPGKFGGDANEQVAAYRIDGKTGALKLLNRQSAKGTAACSLAVDATGKTVLVANYSSGSVAALPVQQDGSLGEAASFIQHVGSSVNTSRQEAPHAHCILVSPDNRFVYAADLGLDQVLTYTLDPATAKLSPHNQPFVRTIPGAGPRHVTFHPNGRAMYVINELANSVTHFDFDPETGFLIERDTISTLPDGFDGESYTADLKITPDGRYLYGTNRGHDSIAAYRIGEDGSLTLLAIHPSLGKGPQNLAITPDGELLLCANMPGNNVAVFRIDAETGDLTSVGEPITATGPSCIMIH